MDVGITTTGMWIAPRAYSGEPGQRSMQLARSRPTPRAGALTLALTRSSAGVAECVRDLDRQFGVTGPSPGGHRERGLGRATSSAVTGLHAAPWRGGATWTMRSGLASSDMRGSGSSHGRRKLPARRCPRTIAATRAIDCSQFWPHYKGLSSRRSSLGRTLISAAVRVRRQDCRWVEGETLSWGKSTIEPIVPSIFRTSQGSRPMLTIADSW